VISAEAAGRASEEPLGLAPPPEALGDAPYAVEEVRRALRDRFGDDADERGYRVYTGIDAGLQRAAREALRSELAAIEAGKQGNYRGPKCSSGTQKDPQDCLQGLYVALDVHTGDVLALVGGRDFGMSQFDRVTQAKRQAGSAFKPFIYATALAQGITIPTPLIGPGAADIEGDYRPADHIADSVSVDLRDGLKLSSNRAAVALGERVGVGSVVSTARSLGISTPVKELPSTFLGAADVIPLELVAAYTAFADGGSRVEPRLVRRVEDASGKVVYQAPVRKVAVLSPEVAFLTTSLMKDVVDHGTGWRVREALDYSIPAAGKTGTTNKSADAWFVGFTPDVAAGAWIGFDQPHRIMAGADGGRLAAPIWGKVMAEYYRTHPVPADWSPPAGVVSVAVDVGTGQLATDACPPDQVRNEWFVQGSEPATYCELHQTGVGGWLRRRLRGIGDLLGGSAPVRTDTVALPPR
jgi:penicillin-binding protein 1A